jgi:hypothetical protein
MKERDKKSNGTGCISVLVLTLLFLPVLYMLSLGPAMWLIQGDYISASTWDAIYLPVLWIADQSDSFGQILDWYMDFFRPGPGSFSRAIASLW